MDEFPWWPVCTDCGRHTVDPQDPPRYDVLNPAFDPEAPSEDFGPYCVECFAGTITGAAGASGS